MAVGTVLVVAAGPHKQWAVAGLGVGRAVAMEAVIEGQCVLASVKGPLDAAGIGLDKRPAPRTERTAVMARRKAKQRL